jgi:2-polyprenyl-6-methoxyphenol hydroxylase-like FAD-dependent oxidoreductase
MIHNIPQPVLEQELTKFIEQDPKITLLKGFSVHGVEQVKSLVDGEWYKHRY